MSNQKPNCVIKSHRYERSDGQVVIENELIDGERHEHYPRFMGQGVVQFNIAGQVFPETVLFEIEAESLLEAFGKPWEKAIERKKNARLAEINRELSQKKLFMPKPGENFKS